MHIFHIRYRNTQGTLMRVLNAASRRGIDMPYVQAEAEERSHRLTLLLDVNPKQMDQLFRDWHAVVDVIDVRAGAPFKELASSDAAWVAVPRPSAAALSAATDAASA